ncbi:outer membrane protein, cobalt-zinc-cadmium efflux system [Mucilaginibacter mallensis]|uniref:Outer membrane protein, cobalt-zinc-cadmium efflux system n=1 Tax=Mucilaginibacter mallensis TaxID=652787 RepID=A0A1H1Y0S7_MUCMA|nr:TolC family protein [Mucilaginibacter mallensis]SDT15021.1 outer membrane protein, cobalt-zinc-cadmium efflux system [Mucilaginibacter mallensis]
MCSKFIKILLCIVAGLLLSQSGAFAQVPGNDTLKITIQQAEEQFLKSNLQLIAQHYNIGIADAQVITAKLFPNPDFNISTGLYNPGTHKFFDQSSGQDEYAGGISQLFTTAGKRNKNIQLAKLGVTQAKYQFFDLLRTLKASLRNDFLTIYFQQQSVKVYDLEIRSLQQMLKAYKEQNAKGNVAEKDVLGIQSQLYSLQAELAGLVVSIDGSISQLQLLIRAKPGTYIEPEYNYDMDGKDILSTVPYQKLLDSAYSNRYDLRQAKLAIDYNDMNLKYQKALAMPDFNLSLGYDKRGSYIINYNSLGIEFNLPFFNRNQGGIKQAELTIDQGKVQLQGQQDQVENDISVNYLIASRYEKLSNSFDPQFKGDFTHLIQEVLKNYRTRNIGLIEFLYFYDSYKVNAVQLNNIHLNRVTALEQLNYVTGTPFFNQ